MSSFIGHTLAGLTTYAVTQNLQNNSHKQTNRNNWLWLIWLIAIASIPDIDYLIPLLRVKQDNQILRITHSFIGTLLIPSLTILVLWLWGNRGRVLQFKSSQVILVGLSHLLLDLSTGVFPLPLLYPFRIETFRFPFGLLPSAGKVQLNNYYLYRNLFIELGVLIPLSISLILITRNKPKSLKIMIAIASGFILSAGFMIWASSLTR